MTTTQSPADVLDVGGMFVHKWYLERNGDKASWRVVGARKQLELREFVEGNPDPIITYDPLPREKWRFTVQADEPTFPSFKSGFVLYNVTADDLDAMVDSLQ